ncbi:MAG TPA: TlpA disulfide reductase family protein [Usitatibacter sp.]|nr:TlpA disulfide reductase family protein [Usitatibacter sp.]
MLLLGRRLAGAAFVLFAALLPAGVLAGAREDAPLKPWKGGPAPRLELEALDGRKFDLAAMRGRVVVVNFWATWCEPCLAEMPSLERLREKMRGRPFEVLAVNYGESEERAGGYVARQKLTLPVLLDPEKRTAAAWKVGGLPMTFLVDARGQVRQWAFGERDWSAAPSVKVIEGLLGEAKRAGS